MPGITIKSTGTQLDALKQAFRTYAAWNERDSADLFLDQARKLATELYVQTAAAAPSKGQIAQDVRRQGWRIPTWFKPGNFGKAKRWGRGYPSNWLDTAWRASPESKRGRGRPSKAQAAAYAAAENAALSRKPTLQDMQAFVIKLRNAARLYIASGWLGAVEDLGGSVKANNGRVDHDRGGADILKGPHVVRVEFWNNTPGVAEQEARHQFVEKAIAVRIVDMNVYIARKRNEALQRIRVNGSAEIDAVEEAADEAERAAFGMVM